MKKKNPAAVALGRRGGLVKSAAKKSAARERAIKQWAAKKGAKKTLARPGPLWPRGGSACPGISCSARACA